MSTGTVCISSFCSGLFLQGCLHSKQPWKIEIVYLFFQNRRLSSMIKIMLLGQSLGRLSCIIIKNLGFLILEFLGCDTNPLNTQHPPEFLHVVSMGLGVKENQCQHEANDACCAMSNKKSFVSDSGVLCLLPASMELW